MAVDVFNEHEAAIGLQDETKCTAEYVLLNEKRNAELRIVFVDDDKIHNLNKRFLRHDKVTDVLSFPLEEQEGVIEGEIYVCIDQAERQAREYGVSIHQEISRLVIHGLLHLIGYDDTTPAKKSAMKEKEDSYLEQLQIL